MQALQKYKNQIIWAAVALAVAVFAVVSYQVSFAPLDAQAAGSTTQIVEVVVTGQPLVIDITAPDDNYHTTSASFDVVVAVSGRGTLTITDQTGRVLWTHDKTDDTAATLTAHVTLSGDPGDYVLTAKIAGNSDNQALATLHVVYEATSLPVLPLAPDTGAYWRVGDYAVPVNQVLSLAIYLVAIVGAIWFIAAKRRRRQKAEESASAK